MIGPDRLIIAAEPHQHRRKHVPATAVGRILFQVLFDLRYQIVERLRGVGRTGALRQRKIAEPWRTERKIDGNCDDRQPNQGHDCRRTT